MSSKSVKNTTTTEVEALLGNLGGACGQVKVIAAALEGMDAITAEGIPGTYLFLDGCTGRHLTLARSREISQQLNREASL